MIRKAVIGDAEKIYSLIHFWAKKRKVLKRSLNAIYEDIRDFWIYENKGKIIGCCALHIVGWQDMAEIKSLVVAKTQQGKGIGTKLVKKCLAEAKTLGIKQIFALTFVPKFFKNLEFKTIDKNQLPHKIWSDCVNCFYFPNCDEQAVILKTKPRR